MHDLEEILDELNRRKQRATYRAVAAVTGHVARGVMRYRAKTWRHSWVVSHKTHLPTGYAIEQMHPLLETNTFVLTTGAMLNKWLAAQTQTQTQKQTPMQSQSETKT